MKIRVFIGDLVLDYQAQEGELWSLWLGFMLRLNPELEFRYLQNTWQHRSPENADRAILGWSVPYDPENTAPPKVPSEMRHLWSHMPQAGDLMLGAHIQGKTLYQCFREDDRESVLGGWARPQRVLGPELVARFGDSVIGSNRGIKRELWQWMALHKLKEGINLTDPANHFFGQPLVGRLISHNDLWVARNLRDSDRVDRFQILLD